MAEILELIDLVKEFNDITVVKKLNMEIEKGELISLLGPSGCGKTTTLKMIGGFLKPKVLLLDEPLSNLDAKLRLKTREEIKELNKKFGTTMIFVTHDQEEALSISDRIAVMNQGIIEQIGSPKEIYNNPKTEFVENFIGSTNKLAIDGNIISIRPEKVVISRGQNTNAKIIGKQFLGSYTIYILKNNNSEQIKVQRLSSSEEFNIGEEVCYCINQ